MTAVKMNRVPCIHPDADCENCKKRRWVAQMVSRSVLMHLCHRCTFDLIDLRQSDKSGSKAHDFVLKAGFLD